MIVGSFDPDDGRPFAEGLLFIPKLKVVEPISFLVDTGSDGTCLMPTDGVRIGIDYSLLVGRKIYSHGIGGRAATNVYRSLVVFSEDNGLLRTYRIDLLIYPRRPQLMDFDSLLGRDILDRWRMYYDPAARRLEFEVVSADRTTSIE